MAIIKVTHEWDDEHGPCYECGDPAAFVAAELYWNETEHPDGPTPVTDNNKMCAVCAAQHAADGMRIYRLWAASDDDPVVNDEHARLLAELGIGYS